MNCEHFLSMLDKMDQLEGQNLPEDMLAHVESCPSCAKELAALKTALALYKLPDLLCSVNLAPSIMSMLAMLPIMENSPKRLVSMRNWLLVGFIIIISTLFLPLLPDYRLLKDAYGAAFTLPLFLALGFILSIYTGVFVISHLDELSTKLKELENFRNSRAA